MDGCTVPCCCLFFLFLFPATLVLPGLRDSSPEFSLELRSDAIMSLNVADLVVVVVVVVIVMVSSL